MREGGREREGGGREIQRDREEERLERGRESETEREREGEGEREREMRTFRQQLLFTSRLPGLMSLWMTRVEWRYFRPTKQAATRQCYANHHMTYDHSA